MIKPKYRQTIVDIDNDLVTKIIRISTQLNFNKQLIKFDDQTTTAMNIILNIATEEHTAMRFLLNLSQDDLQHKDTIIKPSKSIFIRSFDCRLTMLNDVIITPMVLTQFPDANTHLVKQKLVCKYYLNILKNDVWYDSLPNQIN